MLFDHVAEAPRLLPREKSLWIIQHLHRSYLPIQIGYPLFGSSGKVTMTDVLIYYGLGKDAALGRTLIQRTPTTSHGCELCIALGVGRRLRYMDYSTNFRR